MQENWCDPLVAKHGPDCPQNSTEWRASVEHRMFCERQEQIPAGQHRLGGRRGRAKSLAVRHRAVGHGSERLRQEGVHVAQKLGSFRDGQNAADHAKTIHVQLGCQQVQRTASTARHPARSRGPGNIYSGTTTARARKTTARSDGRSCGSRQLHGTKRTIHFGRKNMHFLQRSFFLELCF